MGIGWMPCLRFINEIPDESVKKMRQATYNDNFISIKLFN